MNFGLPGSLWTSFEVKKLKICVKNAPDAATLMLHALNKLKGLKKSKYVFEMFQHFQTFKI